MTSNEIKKQIASILDVSPRVNPNDLKAQDIFIFGDRWKYGCFDEINFRLLYRITETQIKHCSTEDIASTGYLNKKKIKDTTATVRRISKQSHSAIVDLQEQLKRSEAKDKKRALHGNDRYVLWNYAFERVGEDDKAGFVLECYNGNGRMLQRVRMIALEANVIEGPVTEKDPDEEMANAYAELYRDEEQLSLGNTFQIHFVPEMD